jgi:hypothetical protein
MLQVLNHSPVDAPLGAGLVQASAELAQFLATCKPNGMSSGEERVSEIRLRRDAAAKNLADARVKANAINPGRIAQTREEVALSEQIAEIDAELARARQKMLDSRDVFSLRFPKIVDQQLKPIAPTLRQVADAMEVLQDLVGQIDVFAWRNGIEVPRYRDALLSAADLRRLADRIGS